MIIEKLNKNMNINNVGEEQKVQKIQIKLLIIKKEELNRRKMNL